MSISFEPFLEPLLRQEIEQLFSECVDDVAQRLIGHFLFNESDGVRHGGLIVETEAYCANDPAAHCHSESFRFASSAPMLRPGGYVYRHYSRGGCLNLTSGKQNKKFGSAVLIRALKPLGGKETAVSANGPVKLCKFLRLEDGDTKSLQFNDKPLWETSLRLFRSNSYTASFSVRCGRRVGLRGEAEGWPRNYVLADESIRPFLSPSARKNLIGESYPPCLLRQLKQHGSLSACAKDEGCAI
jgi:3-methyladenine DNA glycosylase Mpg